MFATLRTRTIATVTALGLAATAAVPAHAFGDKERAFVQGIAAAMIVDRLLDDVRKQGRTSAQPRPQPQPHTPVYAPAPQSSYSAASAAFRTYSTAERRAIQRSLAAYGYYRGGIDGVFGRGTYSAVAAYARDNGLSDQLASRNGAFAVYDGLIY